VIYFFGPVLDPDLDMNGEENNSENGFLHELLVQEEVQLQDQRGTHAPMMATHF
jgi:hypothetical protein